MPHRPNHRKSRDQWVCHIYDSREPVYARVVGIPYKAEIERAVQSDHVDHVWLTVQIPPCGPLVIALNTLSRVNRDAGYDERVYVGVITSEYVERPEPIIEEAPALNYLEIEAQTPVAFTPYSHATLADWLISHSHKAVRVEAWGELYRRNQLGMHQVHSRRASCAVERDLIGHDGALKFYLPDGRAEMFLFKFCGQ